MDIHMLQYFVYMKRARNFAKIPYIYHQHERRFSFSFQCVHLFLKEQQEKNADWEEQGWRGICNKTCTPGTNTLNLVSKAI